MASPFGSPAHWREDDLIGVSRDFDPDLALAAYAAGVFPMPAPGGLMGWYSPLRRGVLPLDGLRVSRSLRRMLRRYEIRTDTAFDAVLAGGLYGVSVGGLFAGESMFHRPDIGRDASKVALVALVERLREAGAPDRLLDVQWVTPHLASLGVVEIPRVEYLNRLAAALRRPPPE